MLLPLPERLLDFADTFPVALAVVTGVGALGLGAIERAAVAVRRHDLITLEQESGICFVKKVHVPQADRSHGVAVVRARQ